ncbi:MAG: phytase [Pseudomonadota bacterium]
MSDAKVLVAGSNRSNKSISLIEVTIDGSAATFEHIKNVSLDLDDPYGLCSAKIRGTPTIFVGDKDGNVQHWTVTTDYAATLSATTKFETQTEGCVVDTAANVLFVGEEEVGIWALDLLTGDRQLFAAVDGETLFADVEGLDLYEARGEKYLIASSQGDNTYVRYPLSSPGEPVKFEIGANWRDSIDGASETDGLAVYSKPLPGYPAGILVVQDGHNVLPAENQNFKIVDLRAIDD